MEDISLHILDIIQNSIEAQATFIKLEIEEDTEKDFLKIRIDDNGNGMDSKELSQVVNPFYTSRKTRKIGLGLSLLKANAEACNGTFKILSTKEKGTSVTAIFQRSHWDTPPLGDLAKSIYTVFIWDKEIEFFYRHRLDCKEFTFDSKEIKQIIYPLSIDTPAVLMWIKKYINSGLKNLRNA